MHPFSMIDLVTALQPTHWLSRSPLTDLDVPIHSQQTKAQVLERPLLDTTTNPIGRPRANGQSACLPAKDSNFCHPKHQSEKTQHVYTSFFLLQLAHQLPFHWKTCSRSVSSTTYSISLQCHETHSNIIFHSPGSSRLPSCQANSQVDVH